MSNLWTIGVQFVRPDIGTGSRYWKILKSVIVTCILVVDAVTYCALAPLIPFGVSVRGAGYMIGG